MDTKRLQELAGIILNEVSETDMKKLRRVVILAIFSSNIPAQLKKDLNAGASSAPDSDVRKVTKVFLDQVLKDEETLNASPEYQELKQDPEFQKLSQIIVSILNRDNKAGLLDMSNIAFTTSNISKPFSYSTLLYHAVETEASKLLSYLQTKYKDDFKKVLSKMLPSQSRPAIRPTRENLDELSGAEAIKDVDINYTAETVDSRIGTNLAFKNYIFPSGNIISIQGYENHAIDELLKQGIFENDIVTGCTNVPTIWYCDKDGKKIVTSGKDQNKLEAFNALIPINSTLKSISGIQNITDIDDINYILKCIVRYVPPKDIDFYIKTKNSGDKEEYEKGLNDIQMEFNIGLGWFPDDENAMKIIGALSKITKK